MQKIEYIYKNKLPVSVENFFEGWVQKPTQEVFNRTLRNSEYVILARDTSTHEFIGFITCITDGTLSAYIPLLEVRRDYRGQGIGTGLMTQLLNELSSYYMIDLVCDPELQAFYERFGMYPSHAMSIRNYKNQKGRAYPVRTDNPVLPTQF